MGDKEKLRESPSQTAGPYVHIGCTPVKAGISGVYDEDLGSAPDLTDRQHLNVRIFDGSGEPVTDAMIEIWIADADYWTRMTYCEVEQAYNLKFPNITKWKSSDVKQSAPHISLWIVARGVNLGLHTRVYFPDQDNRDDHVLNLVDAQRRQTLIATKSDHGYAFDIHLQGNCETVFFDI